MGQMEIGRSEGLPIQLQDQTVSRHHARIVRDGQRTSLVDLGSANGTWVNERRIAEMVELKVGDRIHFGGVVAIYRTAEDCPRKTRRWLVTASAFFSVCLLGALWSARAVHFPKAESHALNAAKADDPFRECQALGSVHGTVELDWARAEELCARALEKRRGDEELQSLLQQFRLEKRALDSYRRANEALEASKFEEALHAFAEIPGESSYFRKARSRVGVLKESVRAKARNECREYARHSLWSLALPRCETYVTVVCQETEDSNPPSASRDPAVKSFFLARKRLGLADNSWNCPQIPILRASPLGSSTRSALRKLLETRVHKPLVAEAVLMYWDGRPAEALSILQGLRRRGLSTPERTMIESLRESIASADSLFRSGHATLTEQGFGKAKELLARALEHDERAMLGFAKSYPSSFRRSAEEKVAARTYAWGKQWADRKDLLRACRIWKAGLDFNKGSLELSRALQSCSL